jgi:hypothetical protein
MLIAYYPAFAFNRATYDYDIWIGNMTLDAARLHGLRIDASYPSYDRKSDYPDGIAFKAPALQHGQS